MRDVVGYVVAAIAAALIATSVIGFTVGTPFVLRALAFPDFVGAVAPGIAIAGRRLAAVVADYSFPIVAPLVAVAATGFFLVIDLAGLALFRAADSAWNGEPLWEKGKAGLGAVLFAVTAAAVFLVLEMFGGPFAYLRLGVELVAGAAGVGGFVFGHLQPRDLREDWELPVVTTDVSAIRKAPSSIARRV